MRNLPVILALVLFIPFANATGRDFPVYEIEASLDTDNHVLTATQSVTVTNTSPDPVDEINFNVFPHRKYKNNEIRFMYSYGGYFKVNPFPEGFQSGDLRVLKASGDGKPLEFLYADGDGALLTVRLGRKLGPGDSIRLKLDFQVDIPHAYGRFGWHNGIIALNRWYPLLAVLDGQGCHKYPYYLYHHPYFSDAAKYSLSLTLPRGETVACTGSLRERVDNSDGTQTLKFETSAPVRDFSLCVSRRFSLYTLEWEGVKINSYYLPGDAERAREAAGDARDIIAAHSGRFFKYPYEEFSIVPCYLGYGGENSSALIFMDTRVYRLPRILGRYFDFLISHETGHQWFYNVVGSDEYREMFLDEGVNSYWTIRHLEAKYGKDAEVMELPALLRPFIPNFSFRDSSALRYLYMARNGLDRPVIGELSSFQEPSSIFALAYGKGQAVLEMLENLLGREAFDRAMRRYAGEYKFRNASLKDFKAVFEEESGMGLGWFFDEWLNTSRTCDYAAGKPQRGSVVVERRGEAVMPVLTVITFSDGSRQEDLWDGKGEKRIIPVNGRVTRVEVDPRNDIVLDIDRTNNSWPGKTVFKPVPVYFFGYELPMLQDRNAFNAVAGPVFGTKTGLSGSLQKPFVGIGKISSQYDFNGKAFENRLGYELSPAFGRQAAVGFELFDYDARGEADDFRGGRLYYRKELWPASYGLLDANDHVTFYYLHNRELEDTSVWSGREEVSNQVYTRRRESVVGVTGSFARRGPYPDPDYGWRIIPVQEFGGHFLGGTESFWRSSLELDNYILVWPRHNHKIATRLKAGWGGHADKRLFQLGGADDLRGYERKSVQGSRMLLASLEYRLPLARTLALKTPGNFVNLDAVQLAVFFDTGKAWNNSFSSSGFKKDCGLGVRLFFDTIGFLEKTVVRLDAAKPLDGDDREPRFWVGISQAF